MTDTQTQGAARAVAHDAGDQARGIAETGKHEVGKVVSEVKTQTSKLMGDAGSKARDRADSQVGAAATMLGELSGEFEQMASSTSPDSSLASLARDGATMTRHLSERLQRDGLDGALRDARMFARRRPVMFLAGSFAVGLMAGRLMRNVDAASIAPSNADNATVPGSRNGHRSNGENGETSNSPSASSGFSTGSGGGGQATSTAEPVVAETSVPISTEASADIEADWDAPGGGAITGEPA